MNRPVDFTSTTKRAFAWMLDGWRASITPTFGEDRLARIGQNAAAVAVAVEYEAEIGAALHYLG